MRSNLVDLVLYQKLETPKAYGVMLDEEHDVVWLPKSMVERGEFIRKTKLGHNCYEFTMPETLAVEKELI